mmetsp:Transcript_13887/g.20497  ORF Transcript_13887/g.20497 Transcript_13887/m.20497 type:complete len:256 (+) Transcript_13887:91-858(+)|eukprot:CAMPEP_0194210352 /NCGR_PEP_ID=MMETSP0156-20130528/8173_1 /TAXON_ID=33649 /ORGANISM="Thalassionema nitzschioides, Strain L26-B" /LENGTH=255 /DNA_ID=CAMNT_0038937683 /DNA_START=76 /DNA_END=843 /DNA_ORIENTATION=-
MGDAWDDSDDDWDNDDDDLDERLNSLGFDDDKKKKFDEEEDLALKEKEKNAKLEHEQLKKKGSALVQKKKEEQERLEAEELARRTIELETEMEANMTPDQLRALQKQKMKETDDALGDDLFGDINADRGRKVETDDKLVLENLTDHLKHAKKVTAALKRNGNIHFAAAFVKEVIQGSKEVLDDNAISDIIKACNVIKNEKVQAAKKKVKYQANKSKKVDKVAEAKARKLQEELFGDNNDYDAHDEYGEDFEDAFF